MNERAVQKPFAALSVGNQRCDENYSWFYLDRGLTGTLDMKAPPLAHPRLVP